MKYIITFSLLLFSFCSFGQVVGEIRYDSGKIFVHGTRPEPIKCKHIYVAVEQPEVKIPRIHSMRLPIFEPQKTGKHEGQEIVCVKCHHLRKQIIDYGEPMPFGLTMPLHLDTLKLFGGKQLTLPMGGILVDTVSINK